jgi:hypothetical protein
VKSDYTLPELLARPKEAVEVESVGICRHCGTLVPERTGRTELPSGARVHGECDRKDLALQIAAGLNNQTRRVSK